jgi:chromosome segregation ATPase
MRDYQRQFETIMRDLDRLQQEIDHLSGQLAEQDNSQGKKLQTLRKELRQADDDLRSELRDTAQRLTTDKVERQDLGQLFIEIGTQLQAGGGIGDLLKTLIETEQDPDRAG